MPAGTLARGRAFTVRVAYDGTTFRPKDAGGALYGWVSTPDGALVANEPEGASTWFPVNDVPTDKATYTFRVDVPEGTTAVANGRLRSTSHRRRPDDVDLAGRPADGQLPGDRLDRQLRAAAPPPTPSGLPDHRRGRQGPAAGRAGPGRGLAGAGAGDRSRSSRRASGPTRSTPSARSSTTTASTTPWRPRPGRSTPARPSAGHRRARAGAPVVRRQRHARAPGRTSGSTRASRRSPRLLWEHRGGGRRSTCSTRPTPCPAGDPFWTARPGDPGVADLFDGAVYDRGALTLVALRAKIGDAAFGTACCAVGRRTHRGGNVTTADFERARVAGVRPGPLGVLPDLAVRRPRSRSAGSAQAPALASFAFFLAACL